MLTPAPRARYHLFVAPYVDAGSTVKYSVRYGGTVGASLPADRSYENDANTENVGGQILSFAAGQRDSTRARNERDGVPPFFVWGKTWGRPRR